MIMLSRVAERLYWMARYLERAEDTARLTQAYSHLIMDIPAGSEPGWDILIRILDAEPIFGENHRVCNEQNVLKFLTRQRTKPVVNVARQFIVSHHSPSLGCRALRMLCLIAP